MRALYGARLLAANDDARHRSALPTAAAVGHDGGMSDATLTDSKIAAAEARGDTKLARLEGKLDVFAAKIDSKFDAVFSKLDGIASDQVELRSDLKSKSSLTIVTVLGSAIALFGALIAVLAYGGDQVGRGMEVRKAVDDAIQETIRKMPAPPVTIDTDGKKK